ncbi:MAG: ATP-binding protein [Acidimicrobiia bacterium]
MWRFASIRVRTTAAAALVVGIALVAGAALLVAAQRRTLTSGVDAAARARANDLATALADGTLPEDLSVSDAEQALVQVLDEHRTVVAASTNVTGEAPISDVRAPASGFVARNLGGSPVANDRFRLVARSVRAGGPRYTIYVASSLEPVDDGTASLVRRLAAGLPFLVGLVGLTTWLVAGRTLRPVERIRAEVETIQGGDLDRRVPEPRARDEIGRLATTMNAMLDRIEASTERQRRFVADASHELRSPLAGMRSDLEVNLAHPEQAALGATDRELLATTVRMQHLVDDLLTLAQVDAASLPIRHDAVDLDDVVLGEVHAIRAATSVTVACSGVSAGQVVGDRDQLARVVRNLLDNAVRHARTRVDVTLSERGAVVSLVVRDDGPGIPVDERDGIFERFARLDEARDRQRGGAGLGLAIAHDIVAAHGGTISVDDADPGARFVVALPAIPSVGGGR